MVMASSWRGPKIACHCGRKSVKPTAGHCDISDG
jgi:hypothetical protein